MPRMVRKQVYIEPEQELLLKRKARDLGVTEAEVIRRGLAAVASVSSPARDARAWEDELEFIRQRTRLKSPRRKRGWTREELYDERLKRLSR